MTGRPRKASERTRAADPVRNPFVRSPLNTDAPDGGLASVSSLLHDTIGTARAAAEVERTYSARAEAEHDPRGATSHDLLAQTHEAYATALVAIARLHTDETRERGGQ